MPRTVPAQGRGPTCCAGGLKVHTLSLPNADLRIDLTARILKMNLIGIIPWLAFAPPPQQPGQQPNPTGAMLQMLGTFVILGVMFYFVMIRPQQKKARQHADLLKTLKPGDKILTNGGILGTIVSVKDKSVAIRSADTKLEILKSAVAEITERSAGASES